MSPIDYQDNSSWLEAAVRTVEGGGIVALPFERLFGLAADATNPGAVARVAEIKGRLPRSCGPQPISVLLPNRDALTRVAAHVGPLARNLADRYWPGPMTIIVPALPGLPAPLVSERGLIGVRLAWPCPAADLARESNLVLTATSANARGAADALSHHDLVDLKGIDMVVEGQVAGPPGSTVVDASKDEPVVLRQGFLKLDEVLR